MLVMVNSPKDQQNEFQQLQQKKEQHQLQRSDVERLMYLNLILHGEFDEIDNYKLAVSNTQVKVSAFDTFILPDKAGRPLWDIP
jgi:hypothetical protein